MTLSLYLIFATAMFVALMLHRKLVYIRKYTVGDIITMLILAYAPVVIFIVGLTYVLEAVFVAILESKLWNKDLF